MSGAEPHVTATCGIDVGTQGVRAVVVSGAGDLLGSGAAAIAGDQRSGTEHTQPADAWWNALVDAVRAAVGAAGSNVEITALALDATSGTVVVESRDGSPRGAGLMYDDSRAAEQAGRAQAAGAELWAALGYRIQPSWALPKVLWLTDNDLLGEGDRIVHQADHLLRRLTGHVVATDTSHALKTGVDLRSAAWPAGVFADLGIPVSLLPEVVLPGTSLGAVSADAARVTGLAAGTVVRAGMTDGCAAQIAARALRPGSWSSALGTTLVIKGSTGDLVHDSSGAVYCHRNPDGGWLPGGASSVGAGAVREAFPGLDAGGLDRLTVQAADLVPVEGVVYPLTGTGERFPFVAPSAHGFGLDPIGAAAGGGAAGGGADGGRVAVGDADRFGAICQGIAYVERLAYDVLGVLGADVSGPVSLTGGAARNAWWNRLRADVLGRTTLLPSSGQAAVGMAVLAAAPAGHLADTAEAMITATSTFVPDRSRSEALLPGYRHLVGALVDRDWLDPDLATAVLERSAPRQRTVPSHDRAEPS